MGWESLVPPSWTGLDPSGTSTSLEAAWQRATPVTGGPNINKRHFNGTVEPGCFFCVLLLVGVGAVKGGGVKRKPIRLRVQLEIDFYDYWLWLARLLLRVVVIYIDLNTSVNTNYRYTETISFVCRLRCRGPRFTDGFHLICTNHIMKPSILVTYSDVTGGCTPIDGSYAGVSLTLRLGIPTETDRAIETWPSWWR